MRGQDADLRAERERFFERMVTAFQEQDYEALERAMRDDIVLTVPGSSPVSGTHRGRDEVGRFLAASRRALDPGSRPASFRHTADEMVATNEVGVHGPVHDVRMRFEVRVRFDEDGRAASASIEPADVGLFDHVLATAIGQQ
jgi:ketosteroid isomerase-like protein